LLTHLARLKGFDHAVGLRHPAYPLIRFNSHVSKSRSGVSKKMRFYAKRTDEARMSFKTLLKQLATAAWTPRPSVIVLPKQASVS
jgi:hypothetical protein